MGRYKTGEGMRESPKSVSIINVTTLSGEKTPILIADDANGDPHVSTEAAGFLRALSGNLAAKRSAASVLGFLNDYLLKAQGGKPIRKEDLHEVVRHFLLLRRQGDSDGTHGLGWEPLKATTVARDTRILAKFSEYCSKHHGHLPFLQVESHFDTEHKRFVEKLAGKTATSWRLFPSKGGTSTTARGSHEAALPTSGSRKAVLTVEQVTRIINAAPTPGLKAAFILGAFGGMRASEMLHIWTSDVMPGSRRPEVFPSDKVSDVPLVVLAHPSQSRFIRLGESGNDDRLQHLDSAYGLLPRNVQQGTPMHSGWKGMLYDNQALLVSQVYWTSPEMASLFMSKITESRMSVRSRGGRRAMDSHPYLFVNEADDPRHLGLPRKRSGLLKAFARAAIAAGLGESCTGIHLLRHFYKATLEDMGLPAELRRIAMHHRSIVSQDDYALSSARTNTAIRKALEDKNGR